nr:uncharacterized protein LOC102445381 isoform X2 [Pelodiscus sinensis]|eukprot:XP_014424304.1 uncharacterized protein LOC102445381 isoform X2 [Pelodiscus sinensis]
MRLQEINAQKQRRSIMKESSDGLVQVSAVPGTKSHCLLAGRPEGVLQPAEGLAEDATEPTLLGCRAQEGCPEASARLCDRISLPPEAPQPAHWLARVPPGAPRNLRRRRSREWVKGKPMAVERPERACSPRLPTSIRDSNNNTPPHPHTKWIPPSRYEGTSNSQVILRQKPAPPSPETRCGIVYQKCKFEGDSEEEVVTD